ncbi:hypothetical protein Tco_0786399 [Tanacetum coccineum]
MTGGLKLVFLTVLASTASPLLFTPADLRFDSIVLALLGVITVVTSIFSLSTISSINVRSGLRDEFTKLSTAGEAAVEEVALYPSLVLNLSMTSLSSKIFKDLDEF